MQKAVLVKGLFAAVTADGTIRVGEAGLMRLVGAVLDCPLPPLLLGARPRQPAGLVLLRFDFFQDCVARFAHGGSMRPSGRYRAFRQGQGLGVPPLVGKRLRQVVQHDRRIGRALQRTAQHLLRLRQLAERVVRVGEADGGVDVVRPALEECGIGSAVVRKVVETLERDERAEPAALVGGGRDALRAAPRPSPSSRCASRRPRAPRTPSPRARWSRSAGSACRRS